MSADSVVDGLSNIEVQLNNDIKNSFAHIKQNVRRVSRCSEELKTYLQAKYPNGFNLENMLEVVIECIQYLSTVKKLSGQQKRQVIIDAILLLLDETNSNELEVYEPIIKSMIPATINTLIDVEKKKIKLNKRASCWNCCC
jgi:hypothetical protein